MALSKAQISKVDAIRKDVIKALPEKKSGKPLSPELEKALSAVRRSFPTGPQVVYHGFPEDTLRVSVSLPTKLVAKEDKAKIVAILKKHKMIKIQEVASASRSGGVTWMAFDK